MSALGLGRPDIGRSVNISRNTARLYIRNAERRDLLEILEKRHGCKATLLTSQLPTEHWHDYIGSPTLADAILDRVVHRAHRLTLGGPSRRKPNGNGPSATNGKSDA